jgi:hypothetical protein
MMRHVHADEVIRIVHSRQLDLCGEALATAFSICIEISGVEISNRALRPEDSGGRQIREALNMRGAGCVFVGVVFAAILLFGGHVTVPASQKPASAADAPAPTSAQVAWLIFVDDLHLDFVSTGSNTYAINSERFKLPRVVFHPDSSIWNRS